MKSKICFGILIILILLMVLFLTLDVSDQISAFWFKKVKSLSQEEQKKISPENIFKWLDFSKKGALEGWRNKIFKGKTIYWIDQKEDEVFLHSKSESSASALYRTVSYDINKFPIISWKWRPLKFPAKEGIIDLELRDDYALRLYVIFASGFFTNFKCVEYIWDEKIKEGTKMISPYSKKIMQLVIKSGQATEDWVREERNVLKDYISLFGERPKLKVRAIAIMSDSEGSQDSCEAHFKEIKIIKEL